MSVCVCDNNIDNSDDKKLIDNNTIINNDITKPMTEMAETKKIGGIDNFIEIKNVNGLEYLSTIEDGSVDLILTDPPYIISKETGMNKHYNKVKNNEENNIEFVKTEEEWCKYKTENNIMNDKKKENYMKY